MKIDILYPNLPPAFDAIGEHNSHLAAALNAAGASVGLLHTVGGEHSVVEGVESVRLHQRDLHWGGGLARVVQERSPDWLITAYNPFSYGRYGINPSLALLLRSISKRSGTKQTLYIHEGFVPVIGWKSLVMNLAQRQQLRALGRGPDLVITSIEVWTDHFQDLFPGRTLATLPVGSNLPPSVTPRDVTRSAMGLSASSTVLAIFGGLATGRNLPLLRAVLAQVDRPAMAVIYAGPSSVAFGDLTAGLQMRRVDLGRAGSDEVAAALLAADVGLAPFSDGVSERRGSFLAMLQQGLATVTTDGEHTGALLRGAAAAGSFMLSAPRCEEFLVHVQQLVEDVEVRRQMGERARLYYERNHDWPQLASRYLTILSNHSSMTSSW